MQPDSQAAGPPTMIARIWRGATALARGEEYVGYLEQTGVGEYAATPGNRGVLVLRRAVEDRAEFTVISLWDSLESVKGFAGEDIEKSVYYPEDDAYLVDRALTVEHHEVVSRVDPGE